MREQPTLLNGGYTSVAAWDSPTCASLCVYHRQSEGTAKGIIQINHGLAEHGGRYARFAKVLSQAGFHVYVHDHRGHGATTAPGSSQAVFAKTNGWELALQDIKFINAEIQRLHPNIPVILFGHSMGAMLAYNYLLRWPKSVSAAAIWNASISKNAQLSALKFILSLEGLFKNKAAASIVTKLTFDDFNKKFKPNTTSGDWLSKDIAECKAYEDDPDCGWPASISMWKDLASGVSFGGSDKGIQTIPKSMPIFLLGGAADPSVNFGKATLDLEHRLKAAGLNVVTHIRENGRHEALNEPKEERDKVAQIFLEWANTTTS